VIPRDILDRELADFEGLAASAQIAQERVGFRLQRLRDGSFLARAGLRPNDLLLRVDGRPLASIDDCAAAYAQIRVLDRFTVDVVRDGRPVQLRYVIAAPTTAAR
jgi:S1-C subfamily serine protease